MELTKAQEQAIKHIKGNLQIIACAGSGKTEVVSRRIAEIIKSGVKPENILAFTFTEKAAEELKFRIRKKIDESCPKTPELSEMYVGTIHSFCFKILKEIMPKFRNYDVLDEHTRVLLLAGYGNHKHLHLDKLNVPWRYASISAFIRNVDVIREESIDPNDLPEGEFKIGYKRYEELLEKERFLDFSSMIRHVVDLLEKDKSLLKDVQKKYQYITVDEYQDVNPLQEKLIRLLAGANGNLCVVGDDDQAIYQWRGTQVEAILKWAILKKLKSE